MLMLLVIICWYCCSVVTADILWSDDMVHRSGWIAANAFKKNSNCYIDSCIHLNTKCNWVDVNDDIVCPTWAPSFIQANNLITTNYHNIRLKYSIQPIGLEGNDYCRVSYSINENEWTILKDYDKSTNKIYFINEIVDLGSDANNQSTLSIKFEVVSHGLDSDICNIDEVSLLGKPTPTTTTLTKTPTNKPTKIPSIYPTTQPTNVPTSVVPTQQPSSVPTTDPINTPSVAPTRQPSSVPTTDPINEPSVAPTKQPSNSPIQPVDQVASREIIGYTTSIPTTDQDTILSTHSEDKFHNVYLIVLCILLVIIVIFGLIICIVYKRKRTLESEAPKTNGEHHVISAPTLTSLPLESGNCHALPTPVSVMTNNNTPIGTAQHSRTITPIQQPFPLVAPNVMNGQFPYPYGMYPNAQFQSQTRLQLPYDQIQHVDGMSETVISDMDVVGINVNPNNDDNDALYGRGSRKTIKSNEEAQNNVEENQFEEILVDDNNSNDDLYCVNDNNDKKVTANA